MADFHFVKVTSGLYGSYHLQPADADHYWHIEITSDGVICRARWGWPWTAQVTWHRDLRVAMRAGLKWAERKQYKEEHRDRAARRDHRWRAERAKHFRKGMAD